jgi:hypothetical protein
VTAACFSCNHVEVEALGNLPGLRHYIHHSWELVKIPRRESHYPNFGSSTIIHPLPEMDHRKHPLHPLIPPQPIISRMLKDDSQIHMIRSLDFVRFTINLRCRIDQFLEPYYPLSPSTCRCGKYLRCDLLETAVSLVPYRISGIKPHSSFLQRIDRACKVSLKHSRSYF